VEGGSGACVWEQNGSFLCGLEHWDAWALQAIGVAEGGLCRGDFCGGLDRFRPFFPIRLGGGGRLVPGSIAVPSGIKW